MKSKKRKTIFDSRIHFLILFVAFRCVVDEANEILSIVQPFTVKLKKEYPEANNDVEKQVSENCTPPQQVSVRIFSSLDRISESIELFAAAKLQPFPSNDAINGFQNEVEPRLNSTYIVLVCVLNVIDNVTAAYNLEHEWIEPKQAMQPFIERLRNCTTEE